MRFGFESTPDEKIDRNIKIVLAKVAEAEGDFYKAAAYEHGKVVIRELIEEEVVRRIEADRPVVLHNQDNLKPANYMIGQRVIIGNVVCTVGVPDPDVPRQTVKETALNGVWAYNPENGYSSCYARQNVKPLPNGQL